MKTPNLVSVDNRRELSLVHLVDKISQKYLSAAQENLSTLYNNVNSNIRVTGDESVIGDVINGILKAIVMHSRHGMITVAAKELYGTMVEISVKDDNCHNTYGAALCLQDIVPIAERAGGKLDISNRKQRITTVSFTFPIVRGEGYISLF